MPKIAAATDGAEAPEITGPKLVVPAPESAPPPDEPQAPVAPPPVPQQELSLPNGNILHAQVYFNETRIRAATYDQGLTLLENEMQNIEAKYVADVEELTTKRDTVLADLQKRVDDLRLARDMATAPIEIYQKATGQ